MPTKQRLAAAAAMLAPAHPRHSVKTHALPPGWEEFSVTPSGHPGEGWLSANEFAEIMGLNYNQARKILSKNKELESCVRRLAHHHTRFFRPRKGGA